MSFTELVPGLRRAAVETPFPYLEVVESSAMTLEYIWTACALALEGRLTRKLPRSVRVPTREELLLLIPS